MTYTRTSCSHEGTTFNNGDALHIITEAPEQTPLSAGDINKRMVIDLIRGVWAAVSMTANDSWSFSLNTERYCSRPLILGANYQYFFSIKLSWNQTWRPQGLCFVKGRHFMTWIHYSRHSISYLVTVIQCSQRNMSPYCYFIAYSPTHGNKHWAESSRNSISLSGYCHFAHAGCFRLPVFGLSAISAEAERTC